MRLLFTFMGGHGHFLPLLPIAHAAAAGHTVAFACGPAMRAAVQAAGFTTFVLGAEAAHVPERLPLRPVDMDREAQEFRDHFVRRAAHHRAPLTEALAAEWRPEVLVCDEADFGALVAAERLGLPHARVVVLAAGGLATAEVIAEALAELRAAFGLPPEPPLAMCARDLVLSPCPPSFRDPAHPLPAAAISFRPHPPIGPAGPRPAWAQARPGAPTVYFTLGTIFNLEAGDLFSRVLAGLSALPVNVIATTGPHIDPAEFGAQPAHVHLAVYMAQAAVLPHCALMVSHGGSGSVLGALAHGQPMVLIPLGADQPLNAARCAQLGVARVLDPLTATPAQVRAAVAEVLAEPHYRQAAERLQEEFAGLPGPAHAVEALTQLAASRRPAS